jgi:hypothetical protein
MGGEVYKPGGSRSNWPIGPNSAEGATHELSGRATKRSHECRARLRAGMRILWAELRRSGKFSTATVAGLQAHELLSLGVPWRWRAWWLELTAAGSCTRGNRY